MPANTIQALQGKSIVVLGYGNQGRAHALNLRDSGLDVRICTRNTSIAIDNGFDIVEPSVAAKADLLIVALPDEVQKTYFESCLCDNLHAGVTLGFIHGFSIHYKYIEVPDGVGVIMVAPKGPGSRLRSQFEAGSGIPALLAVHCENELGSAKNIAYAWAVGIGSERIGVIETTFQNETETDLFGEQAIIVGGMTALIKASFETLVEAGYPPKLAYIECCHEVKQVADIIFEKGLSEMMSDISNTAEMGAYVAMDTLDDEQLREKLRTLLTNIQDGTFAKNLVEGKIQSKREALSNHLIESVGDEMRSFMRQDTD